MDGDGCLGGNLLFSRGCSEGGMSGGRLLHLVKVWFNPCGFSCFCCWGVAIDLWTAVPCPVSTGNVWEIRLTWTVERYFVLEIL